MFTQDAPKKWYFASSKYTLLEVGIQLMLVHNLPKVDLHIRLSTHCLVMDEQIIKVAGCKISYWSEKIQNTSFEWGRGIA